MKVLAIINNYSAFGNGYAEFEPSLMVNLNKFPWTEYATIKFKRALERKIRRYCSTCVPNVASRKSDLYRPITSNLIIL